MTGGLGMLSKSYIFYKECREGMVIYRDLTEGLTYVSNFTKTVGQANIIIRIALFANAAISCIKK